MAIRAEHLLRLRPSLKSTGLWTLVLLLLASGAIAPVMILVAAADGVMGTLFAIFAWFVFAGSVVAVPRFLWPTQSANGGMALLVGAEILVVVSLYFSWIVDYGIAVSASLCGGREPAESASWAIGSLAYACIGSWAFRSRGRVLWAWPLAVVVGILVLALVRVVVPGAHGHCET